MDHSMGKASMRLDVPVEIFASASVVGTKEGQGPLKALFDVIGENDAFGAKTWEEAESNLQREAFGQAVRKAGIGMEEIRYLFAGDLLGQSMASSFGLEGCQIPYFGLYGACSTCGEALTLGAMTIAGGYADVVACVTSSHFASAEREFRFPLEYGNQRPLTASWTVTGSGAFLLRRGDGMEKKGTHARARICGMTVGRIVDYGLKDSMNMGACMAPAAADVILRHFQDWGRGPEDYDHLVTGDLGSIGQTALKELLRARGVELGDKLLDCGTLIYDTETQDVHAGGSGCGCSAVTLSAYLLKQLEEGLWKRILFLPTGALLSKVSYNEGKSVPGICHAIVLETAKET